MKGSKRKIANDQISEKAANLGSYIKDVNFEDLQTVVQFMYNGVVNVSSEKLPAILKTADTLQIKVE